MNIMPLLAQVIEKFCLDPFTAMLLCPNLEKYKIFKNMNSVQQQFEHHH